MKYLGKSDMLLKAASVFLVIFLLIGCSKKETRLRKDADIIRLRHLTYYGRLIEQYYRVAGKYPLQQIMPMPLYIYVANDQQVESAKQQEHTGPFADVPFSVFVKQVESVLAKEISEYYDPQYPPDDKPDFYVYTVHNETYHFSVYVRQPYPFARRVAENYYAVEISSDPDPDNKIYSPDQLFNSPGFNKELNRTISNEAFFREIEKKYLHHTKSKKVKQVPVPEKDIM